MTRSSAGRSPSSWVVMRCVVVTPHLLCAVGRFSMNILPSACLSLIVSLGLTTAAQAQAPSGTSGNAPDGETSLTLPELSVSAPADSAFFVPDTASQGIVTGKEIEEQPRSRVGEVLEVVPGLIATQRSRRGQGQPVFLARIQPRSRHRYRHHARGHAGQHAHARAWPKLCRSQFHDPGAYQHSALQQGPLFP
jgi:hypothetical protein